jgi:hypothetical protein
MSYSFFVLQSYFFNSVSLSERWQKPNVLFVRWAFCMLPNGLGLGEVGEIEAQMFNKPPMLIEVRMFKFSTSAPILPNPCSSDTSGEQKK